MFELFKIKKLEFGKFLEFSIWIIPQKFNSENVKNSKFAILKIPKIFQILQFENFKIPYISSIRTI